MRAMLLGAGRGTRLAPLTYDVPKILVPLGDRTLLERQGFVSFMIRSLKVTL